MFCESGWYLQRSQERQIPGPGVTSGCESHVGARASGVTESSVQSPGFLSL